MGTKTALYRHFNKDNELLYVGISLNALNRLAQHKDHSHWFNNITNVQIEQFETRELALKAEREAVLKENPKHNIKLRMPAKQIKVMEEQAIKENIFERSRKEAVHNHVNFYLSYTIDDISNLLNMSKKEVQKYIDNGLLNTFYVEGKPSWKYPDKVILKPRISGWAMIDFVEYLQQREISNYRIAKNG